MACELETNIIAYTGRHPQTRSPKVLAHFNLGYFGTGYLGVLGDLNHSNPFVRQTLVKWVREMVQNYSTLAARRGCLRAEQGDVMSEPAFLCKMIKMIKAYFGFRVFLAVDFLRGSTSHKTVRLMRFRRLAAGHCHLPRKRLFARGTGLDPCFGLSSKQEVN